MFPSLAYLVLALSAVTTFAFASTTPTHTIREATYRNLNPPVESLVSNQKPAVSQLDARSGYITNAKRLAAGMPLNPPRRRGQGHTAPRALPSGVPGLTGYLEIIDRDSGISQGFVRNTWNRFGEFGLTEDINQRLSVVIDTVGAAVGPVSISTTNGPDVLCPFFGGVVGFSANSPDFSIGSYNYAYFAGTTFTNPLSPPVSGLNAFTAATTIEEKIESSLFHYDPISRLVTSQWINTDGSAPAVLIGYNSAEDTLLMTGDGDAFISSFGPTQWVNLRFVLTS